MIIRTIKLTIALACLVAPCARGMQLSQGQIDCEVERLFGAIRASSQCENGSRQADDIKRDFARGFYLLGPLARHPLSPDARNRLDQDLPEHAPRSCQDYKMHFLLPADKRANEPIMEIIYRGAPWLLDYALDMIDQSIRSNGLVMSAGRAKRLVIRNMNMGAWTLPIQNERGQEASAANLAHIEEISLLHTAAVELRPEMVARLIARGADVNATANTVRPFPNSNVRGARKVTTPLFCLATTVKEPHPGRASLDHIVRHANELRTPEDRDAQLRIATLLAEAGARNIGGTETEGCARGALSIADLELFRHLMQYPSIQQSTQLWGLVGSYMPPNAFICPTEDAYQMQNMECKVIRKKIRLLLLHASADAVNYSQYGDMTLEAAIQCHSLLLPKLLAWDTKRKLTFNATSPHGETRLDKLTRLSTTYLPEITRGLRYGEELLSMAKPRVEWITEELRQQQADNDLAPGAAPGDPAGDGQDQ